MLCITERTPKHRTQDAKYEVVQENVPDFQVRTARGNVHDTKTASNSVVAPRRARQNHVQELHLCPLRAENDVKFVQKPPRLTRNLSRGTVRKGLKK